MFRKFGAAPFQFGSMSPREQPIHYAAGEQFEVFDVGQVLRLKQHDAPYNTRLSPRVPDKMDVKGKG
jgi:hypothetical protein